MSSNQNHHTGLLNKINLKANQLKLEVSLQAANFWTNSRLSDLPDATTRQQALDGKIQTMSKFRQPSGKRHKSKYYCCCICKYWFISIVSILLAIQLFWQASLKN